MKKELLTVKELAAEGLTQVGTVTKSVTTETTEVEDSEDVQKILKNVVSRPGLEPGTLALKGRCSTN